MQNITCLCKIMGLKIIMMKVKLDRKKLFKLIRKVVFNKKFAIALVIVVVIYTVGNRGARDQELIKTQNAQVEAIKKTVTATGVIRSQSEVNLKFQTSGKVSYINAKQGNYVKKGQLIAQLDTVDLQKRLQQDLNTYFKERLDFEDIKDSQRGGPINIELERIAQRAQADLNNSVIDVELRDLSIKYSTLNSPIEGYITQNPQVLAGSNILATETITSVADLDNRELIAGIDEVDIGQIKEGQAALISLDAFEDSQIEANVKTISKKAIITSTQSTVFEVIFELPKGQDFLLGMNGTIEVQIEKKDDVLLIPVQALIDEKHVWVKENNTYFEKEVSTGLESDEHIEIISGIGGGEEVVTSGFEEVTKASLFQKLFSKLL